MPSNVTKLIINYATLTLSKRKLKDVSIRISRLFYFIFGGNFHGVGIWLNIWVGSSSTCPCCEIYVCVYFYLFLCHFPLYMSHTLFVLLWIAFPIIYNKISIHLSQFCKYRSLGFSAAFLFKSTE